MVIEVGVLALIPISLIIVALVGVEQAALISFAVVVGGILMLLVHWEGSPEEIGTMVAAVVLGAIAAAGRLIFAAAPNIQPVTALCVLSGAVFGRRSGFMTGALAAIASNCFLGQGLWTPWQMYSWGLVGYLTGVLFMHVRPTLGKITLFGFIGSFLFGAIMNTWSFVGFIHPLTWEGAALIYGGGFLFDLPHGISTALFAACIYGPWRKKLARIKRRFVAQGFMENRGNQDDLAYSCKMK